MKNNRIRKSLILGISLILVTSSIGAFSVAQGNTVDTVTSATTQEKTNTNSTPAPESTPKSTPKSAPKVKTTPVPAPIPKTETNVATSTARTIMILIDSKTDYKLIFNEQLILTAAENMDGTTNQALEFYKGNTLEQVITTLKSKSIITEPYQFVIQSDDLTTLLDQYHKSEAYKLTHTEYDEHYDHENYEDYEDHKDYDDHEHDDHSKPYGDHHDIED